VTGLGATAGGIEDGRVGWRNTAGAGAGLGRLAAGAGLTEGGRETQRDGAGAEDACDGRITLCAGPADWRDGAYEEALGAGRDADWREGAA
jgi:hypothetical protein